MQFEVYSREKFKKLIEEVRVKLRAIDIDFSDGAIELRNQVEESLKDAEGLALLFGVVDMSAVVQIIEFRSRIDAVIPEKKPTYH